MLGSVVLDNVNKIKYLGQIITADMTDDADIARQNRNLCAQGNMTIRKFHMCSLDVKIKLFESHCSPLYCAHLWWNYKKGTMTQFAVSYHSLLKRVIGLSKFESTSATCAIFRVQSCASVIRNLIYRFLKRVEVSDNALVNATVTSDVKFRSSIRRALLMRLHSNGSFLNRVV